MRAAFHARSRLAAREPGAPRPAQRRRRCDPRAGGRRDAHAAGHAGPLLRRGARPRGPDGARPRAGWTSCRASARSSRHRRWRWGARAGSTTRASPRLPRPPHRAARAGDRDELRALVGRLFAQKLDRTKPLWELWLVEGLGDGGFALVSKTHAALVDGVSGADPVTTLFDDRRPPRAGPALDPAPGAGARAELTAGAGRPARWALARPPRPARLPRRHAGARGRPRAWAQSPPRVQPAPPTPAERRDLPHRRVAFLPAPLADLPRDQGRPRRDASTTSSSRSPPGHPRLDAQPRPAHRGHRPARRASPC